MKPEIKDLILELYDIGAIKFGSFTLKSGILSPVYIDLRLVISYPPLMKKLSSALNTLTEPLTFHALCGVPYAALPIATALSLDGSYPMIMCRKETKEHGTKKMIEGKYEKEQTCLLIEDVVTSGGSILETANALRNQDMKISDAIVILDRMQGGKQKLRDHNIELHALVNIFDLLKVLFHEKKITQETMEEVVQFLGHQ